jgi:predicted ribosomally synthesized peptide with SipW-like signal peptide
MKKMLIALMAVLITVALAGIGTYAYFSDTKVSSANTFAAGTLVFKIVDPGVAGNQVFNVTGMKPGQVVTDYLVVANDGTMDMKWKAWLSSGYGAGTLFDVLKIRWIINPSDYTDPTGYTSAGPADGLVMDWRPIADLTGPDNGNMQWKNPGAVAFQPGWAAVYKIEVKIDENAGDTYQGNSYIGDLNFLATQYENPNW